MNKAYSAIVALAVLAGCGKAATNTIGVYPGNPEENFAPTLVPAGEEYRNLALLRAAMQSSAIDVNQSAQLVTDGLMADEADFRSAWKSAGGKDEWIAVDLCANSSIEKLVFHWLNGPVSPSSQCGNAPWKRSAFPEGKVTILRSCSAACSRVTKPLSTATGRVIIPKPEPSVVTVLPLPSRSRAAPRMA